MRSKHPVQFDQANLRTDVKARWSDEEIFLLARREAELVHRGGVRFMNKAQRSIEAIKKTRQKAVYRDIVQRACEEIAAGPDIPVVNTTTTTPAGPPVTPSARGADEAPSTPPSAPANDDHFIESIRLLPKPRGSSFNSNRLVTIVEQAIVAGKETTFSRLSTYLLNVLPVHVNNPRPPPIRINTTDRPVSRRKLRRQEYAQVQRNWKKHQSRCIKTILDGPNNSVEPPKEVMEPYWRAVMEQSNTSSPPMENLQQPLESVWTAITGNEIKATRPPVSTSPGPDEISARQLRAIPIDILVRIFNLILWCGQIPLQFREAKTIFIPKKTDSSLPVDFRPITIPSVIVRQLHAILAKRLSDKISFDPRQKAFLPTDGCSDNTTLVDLLLRSKHTNFASCYLASLDVRQAYDSASHNAIFGTLTSYGLPEGFIRYLELFYKTSTTKLVGQGWTSGSLRPKRGVKKGDPLSPILFNILIDRLLRSLPRDIGCAIGTSKTNAIAFADDLVICASTPLGLQTLIDHTYTYLTSCGLVLNHSKCMTISIKSQPKEKRTVVEERNFKVNGADIPALKRNDAWKYLGIQFTADGNWNASPKLH